MALLAALTLGAPLAAPAAAATKPFNPKVTVARSTPAARAATSFTVKITQTEGEEQIGDLKLLLPRNPGFLVNTNVAGDGAQIGTIHVVLYTGPSPGAPLTIDGTLHDHNDRSFCTTQTGVQCVQARLQVADQEINAELEIYEDASSYRIQTDLTPTWGDSNVTQLQGRLAELSATLNATAGADTVVRNPSVAGSVPFTWDLTSASVPGRGYTGGLKPPCATSSCSINLVTSEYAPSAPGLQAPGAGAALFLSTSPTAFSWTAARDANGDPLTYALLIDGDVVAEGSGLSATYPLAAGQHSWRVIAKDDHGFETSSAARTLTVIDPGTALVFTSINNDRLYIVPGAYLYTIDGNPKPLGSETPSATVDQGYVVATGAFTLAIAYDATTRSAAGSLTIGNTRRVFTDLPG